MSPCPENSVSYEVQRGDSLWLLARRFHTTIDEIASANPMLHGDRLYIGQVLCIPTGRRPEQVPVQFPQSIGMYEQMVSNHLRMLWEQHVYWTRLAILSMVFGLPDEQVSANRLLRNPKDFEALLKLFYGEETAAAFADLFTSHLAIAAELVKATKAGDSAAAGDAERRWYANADQIADFLEKINPYWSAQEWQKMFYDHLAMTKKEAVELLTQKFADSVETFDRIEKEALAMADAMTLGLFSQFPSSF